MLTKDSVTVSVDAVVYYRVSNPTISVANVENAHHSTRLLAQTTLRNILGTKNMSEILSDRESISHGMQVVINLLPMCEGNMMICSPKAGKIAGGQIPRAIQILPFMVNKLAYCLYNYFIPNSYFYKFIEKLSTCGHRCNVTRW